MATKLASDDIARAIDTQKFNIGTDVDFLTQNALFDQQAGMQNQLFDQQMNLRQADLDAQRELNNANIGNQMLARDQGIFNTILGQQNTAQNMLSQQGLLRNQYEQQELDALRREFDREQNQGLKILEYCNQVCPELVL